MADKSFADAALERFKGSDAPKPAEGAAKEDDASLGKMLAAALRRSDGEAICAAVRKICGDESYE